MTYKVGILVLLLSCSSCWSFTIQKPSDGGSGGMGGDSGGGGDGGSAGDGGSGS